MSDPHRAPGSRTLPAMDPVQLRDESELEALLEEGQFLLFKHSLICPVSSTAFREYRMFLEAHPETRTGWIDVIGDRPMSLGVAERTGIQHESPQAIVFDRGRAVWDASHGAITRTSLAEALASAD